MIDREINGVIDIIDSRIRAQEKHEKIYFTASRNLRLKMSLVLVFDNYQEALYVIGT